METIINFLITFGLVTILLVLGAVFYTLSKRKKPQE